MSDKETAPTIPQLASEIRNLAHLAWTDPKNAEYLFSEIEGRAKEISAIAMECRAPAPQPAELELEQESDGRWLAEFLRFTGVMAYGKSPEEAIRNAAKVLIESEQASPTPKKCPTCGSRDRGTFVTPYCPDSWHSSPGTTKGTK